MTDSYRSEDVQQILQRTMTRRQEREFSHEQLVEMASELGISADNLQIAEQEWLTQRGKIQERKEFDTSLRVKISISKPLANISCPVHNS